MDPLKECVETTSVCFSSFITQTDRKLSHADIEKCSQGCPDWKKSMSFDAKGSFKDF